MIEVNGSLWSYPADVRVITTNGSLKNDGTAVMGRGCAWEAAQRWSYLPKELGLLIKQYGNKVHWIPLSTLGEQGLFTFPTKHLWYEGADPALIINSATEIQQKALKSWNTIVMPRPGCGYGSLNWVTVKPLIQDILDNRFHVIHFGEQR